MALDVRDWRVAALGVAVCWLLCAAAQPAGAQPAVNSPGAPSGKEMPAAKLAPPAAGGNDSASRTPTADEEIPGDFSYRLQLDNNLLVRAAKLDAKGMPLPARVKVTIAQDGQIIASVRTDEWGRAQVVGLKPAAFSVLAVSEEGFAAFRVRVAAYVSPEEARKKNAGPKLGSVWQTPLESRRDSSAVEINMVPATEFTLMKSLMQHKGAFSLFVAREGEIVDFIRPGENWVYGMAAKETGCYSLLGAGVTRGSRGLYAYRVYHLAAVKETKLPQRPSTQLLRSSNSARFDLCGIRLCQLGIDGGDEMTVSPVPMTDLPVLEQMVTEVGGAQFGIVPAAAAAAGAPVAGAAGGAAGAAGGVGGLGGMMGAVGGLAGGLAGGGGGEGGGGGGGGPSSQFTP